MTDISVGAVNFPSKPPPELALEHFDAFYKSMFGSQWPSVRISLLSLPKYAAIINNASDSESSVQLLMEQGAQDLIQEAVNIHQIRKGHGKNTAPMKVSSNTSVDKRNQSFGQCCGDGAEISQEEDKNSAGEIQLSEAGTLSNLSPVVESNQKSFPAFLVPTTQLGALEQKESDKSFHHVDDIKNLLTPDAVKCSADLEYFMPTEQVFSEKEELRLQEYSQSVYHENVVSVPIMPGQFQLLPKSLKMIAFPPGDLSDFPKPLADKSHLLNYYLLDASSILPVLALDVQPGEKVLDLCAAPGGKSLALLQILLSQGGHLDTNDVSWSRVKRLKSVLRSYLPGDLQQEFVTVSGQNGLTFRDPVYNKVLVDVPCNSDRHVLLEEDNNLFKPGRIKERLKMTTQQKDLLLAGIKSCKPGGSVVYSTCTLAAVQNDGVVQAAVEELCETSNIDVAVEDLSDFKAIFSPFFRFHPGTRLGLLVMPSLLNNYGPTYCCKLRRLQ
ncbi:5-cytosine rRNA methyltransferase NSUN4-like isoform X2 [Babylonia areolata]|uniref:5-cytosine rRNA methyltransferase NSUN4-like isoform X2 n=1 Tax=Babylonia areolata TaxID=304850 RepID=UPI003FD4DBA6